MSDLISRRVFKGIVVSYPSFSTYPEFKGKPYFSIRYTENGQGFIGFGTYKPEVLSEYLKEYFMPSTEPKKGKWIVKDIDQGYVECPFCGSLTTCEYEDAISDIHYCFNCGADMREEKHELKD